MPQLLALEWNGSEARLALASGRGGQVVIEQAFSVPLASQQPGAENEEVDVGGRIAAALAAKGIGRIDALVGLGRTNIKLRQLHLPAALDDELPEMVRLQAMQEFNDLDEQWLLDFVSIDHTPDGPRTVLVAAVEPELVQQIQDVCQSAGLKMRRLIPRAYAAASLVGRAGSGRSDQLRLLVDLLDDEADLTAMIDGKVVFLRSTRLSGAPSQSKNLAIGLSLDGEDLWNYALPTGIQQQPIEPIISGRVTREGPGQWIFSGPDGSIHILAADGAPLDKYNSGVMLQGLATVEIDGQPALIISSADGVEAWKVE